MERKKVAALKYKKGEDNVPRLLGLGEGNTAERIVDIAKEHNIPLYSDKKLVDQLLSLEIGDSIPPELYKVVAEVLVFVYSADQQAK